MSRDRATDSTPHDDERSDAEEDTDADLMTAVLLVLSGIVSQNRLVDFKATQYIHYLNVISGTTSGRQPPGDPSRAKTHNFCPLSLDLSVAPSVRDTTLIEQMSSQQGMQEGLWTREKSFALAPKLPTAPSSKRISASTHKQTPGRFRLGRSRSDI